jgi:hypothetical protein
VTLHQSLHALACAAWPWPWRRRARARCVNQSMHSGRQAAQACTQGGMASGTRSTAQHTGGGGTSQPPHATMHAVGPHVQTYALHTKTCTMRHRQQPATDNLHLHSATAVSAPRAHPALAPGSNGASTHATQRGTRRARVADMRRHANKCTTIAKCARWRAHACRLHPRIMTHPWSTARGRQAVLR